ncbi:hypothetical protein Tco_1505620 [Tanacetum coccineum]
MAGLNFADSHNMVAYLEKSIENVDFAEIVDFLNANPIRQRFSRTVTPLFSSMLAQQADMGERPRKAKRASEISQFSGPIPLVVDETVTKEKEDIIERVATIASGLEAEQDSGNINRTQSMATLNEPCPQGTSSGSGPRCQDTILRDAKAQTRFETISKQSNNPPLSRLNTLGSGEDRLKLKEFMDLYTKLSDRVLNLETTKIAQAKKIANFKKRVKNLERKRKSRPPRMNLFKIGTSRRRSLGERFDKEFDANMDEAIEQVYDANKDTVEEGEVQVPTADMEVNTASASVTTAGVSVSTTEPITTVIMRSEKSKVRGVVMKEPSETATRPTVPPQQHDPKDKGNAQMQVELEEEERLVREREEDANIAKWNNAQAMIDADYKPAARIQKQEQEELTIKEKSRLFVELIDKRKKHFARLRAKEQRRQPLNKAQKRNQIFDEVQKAFDKTMSWIDSFVPVDSELVKGSKVRAEGSETRAEGSSKRAGEDLQQESTKKQKMGDDKEKEELKQCFKIVPDDGDDVTIDVTPLSVKIIIVDYKIYQEGKKSFFQIIRADGSGYQQKDRKPSQNDKTEHGMPYIVMSDSEDSIVTYTAVSSPFESLSDIGSPGVDGPPMMPEDPYAYVVAAFQSPPSPDYVPGLEEPEQAPPLPEFVLELEDLPDYPTDRDEEEEEEEEPSGDEADDEEEDENDEKEEEEHPASADSVPPPPVHRTTARISIPAQALVPFLSEEEVERLLAILTLPPSPLTPLSSPLPQIPSPPLPVSPPLPISPPPLPSGPTYPLGFRAAMIRQRAESPSTSHLLPLPPPIILSHTKAPMAIMMTDAPSTYTLAPPSGTPPLLHIPLPTPSPPLLLPSTDRRVDKPEMFRTDYGFVATLDADIRRDPERDVGYGITDTWDEMLDVDEIYGRLDEAQVARAVLRVGSTYYRRIDTLMLTLLYSWRERLEFPVRPGDGTTYGDTETGEYTADTGDSTAGSAGTRWRSSTVTPPDGAWTEYVSEGVTSSYFKHKAQENDH